jgi:hypothetical protein
MKKVSFILLLFIGFARLRAEDSLSKIYLLSENVRDIVLKAPGGHPMPRREFYLTTMQADQMKALSSLDDEMRTHLELAFTKRDCDKFLFQPDGEAEENMKLEKRVDNRNFQIELAVFSSDKKFEQVVLDSYYADEFKDYMDKLSQDGNKPSENIASLESLVDRYRLAHPKVNLELKSFSEKEKILSEYADRYLGVSLPEGFIMKEMTYWELVNNSGTWKETLTLAKNNLSSQQKIELVSRFGDNFLSLYSEDRMKGGPNGTFVSTIELLDSLKNKESGGICRDIALSQTQMLKELGFTNAYVVTFKAIEAAHASVIATDPQTGKIIKFNYGETYESKKGSGTEALIQQTSVKDYGLEFKIYDSNGKAVTHIPSELSLMLREATGADRKDDFNPKNFSLTSANFKSSLLDGSLFAGKTSSGDNVYGASLFKNMAINQNLDLSGGVSLSKIEGRIGPIKVDQQNLYLRGKAELSSPEFALGALRSKAFLGGIEEILLSDNKETNLNTDEVIEVENELSSNPNLYLGIKSSYETPIENTKVESKIYATFFPDWDHIARNSSVVLVSDSVILKSGVSHQISEDTRALVDTAVIIKNYGSSLVINASIEDDKNVIRYNAGMAIPLVKDMPSFLPGAETRAFAGVEKITDRFIFTLVYEHNFDNDSNNVQAKGEFKF